MTISAQLLSGTPNLYTAPNTNVVTGGSGGAILGNTASEPVGFHGTAVVQSTGYGTPVGNVVLASFNAGSNVAPANATVVAQAVAELYRLLLLKGFIGS